MTESRTEPEVETGGRDQDRRLRLIGDWTAAHAAAIEDLAEKTQVAGGVSAIDLSGIGRLDTIGAVVIDRLTRAVTTAGGKVTFEGGQPDQRALLDAVAKVKLADDTPAVSSVEGLGNTLSGAVAGLGRVVVSAGEDLKQWVGLLGAIVASIGMLFRHPRRFRLTPFVYHLDHVGLRAVPIIALISFLVGAIVAQQSVLQLRTYGAAIFVADLIGVLSLRELGVLLTSIMLAGRSGSAFTAEIGSMKMREEIDAMRVMGLDSIQVLILPRLLALVVGLTMLTFIAELALMGGGVLVGWIYGGITPEIFIERLRGALTMKSFMVGMIKAPVMGLVIALIATIEGLKVEGSAESLGLRTTASVVKAIFMVIVLDGIFAMLFAAIGM